MRPRFLILLFFTLFATAALCPTSASAQDAPTSPSTTSPPEEVSIGNGMAFTSALVTTEGAAPEQWDGNHAAVFVQSWLGGALFGDPVLQDPPAGLPVYRLDITGTWDHQPGTKTAYYASDGTTAWVSLPLDQTTRSTVDGPAPAPSKWFVANDRAVGAFNGTEKLIDSVGVEGVTSTTVPPGAEQASSPARDDGGSTPVIPIVIGIVLVAAIAFVVVRSRRTNGA